MEARARNQLILTFFWKLLTSSSLSPGLPGGPFSAFYTDSLSPYPGECVFLGSKFTMEARMVQKEENLVIVTPQRVYFFSFIRHIYSEHLPCTRS